VEELKEDPKRLSIVKSDNPFKEAMESPGKD